MAITIITDSTSYIDKDVQKQYGIEILSLFFTYGNESIKEVDVDNKTFYQRMEKEGIPISSQPSIGETEALMRSILDKGNDIIGVFISSDFSGTFNSASLVANTLKEEYPDRKITIIDSRSNSMQLGFSVLVGARLAKKGESYSKIVEAIEANTKHSRFLFIPDNLDYLEKGGRIGKAGALFGNMLKITPILTVEDGSVEVYKKVRTKKRAILAMVDKMNQDNAVSKIKEIAIHHINCMDEALEFEKILKKNFDVDILISSIGPVIGLHVGPGAVGVVYYTDAEIPL
ncbi:MAG: DegV family protein [Erysipelothrix sp.]|nr:DegV family protein [Erysipelothrix sp.]